MAKAKTTLLKVLPIFRLIDGQTGLGGFPFHLHAKAVEVKSIIGLTTRLCKSARAGGIRLDHLQQQHEDHWLSRSATRLQMLEATVAFLRTNNPPD
jgi:hypothetical protein